MPVPVSEESMWFLIVLIIGLVILGIFVAFVVMQGPESFIWQYTRSLFYDVIYFFFGPRIVEV
ncbi:MAG: hypothetical protein ACE5J7_00190 [Candidatus Aenigmatarchaeota archaeon]